MALQRAAPWMAAPACIAPLSHSRQALSSLALWLTCCVTCGAQGGSTKFFSSSLHALFPSAHRDRSAFDMASCGS